MAGAIAELARKALARGFQDHRSVNGAHHPGRSRPARAARPSTSRLSAAAKRALEKLGVEVRLDGAVTACDAAGVALGGERIEARTIIWAAGVMASPAGKWLNAKTDRSGRVIVGPDLTVPGHPDIYVLGDAASAAGADGKPLPGVAPVAKQQGAYVGEAHRRRTRRRDAAAIPLS